MVSKLLLVGFLCVRRLRIGLHGLLRSQSWICPEMLISVPKILPGRTRYPILLLAQGSGPLQRRLVRGHQQASAVGARIIDKLPLVVAVLLVKLADCLLFTQARDSNDCSSSENLRFSTGALPSYTSKRPGRTARGCLLLLRLIWRRRTVVLSIGRRGCWNRAWAQPTRCRCFWIQCTRCSWIVC